jgi:hypothetical protein
MKVIIIAVASILFCLHTKAQKTGNPKVDALLENLKKQTGSKQALSTQNVVIKAKGIVVNDNATLVKSAQGFYVMGSSLISAISDNQIQLYLSNIAAGKQTLSTDKKKSSIAIINGTTYELEGEVIISVKNNIISASFKGQLFEIIKHKSNSSKTPTGPITADFKGLTLSNLGG